MCDIDIDIILLLSKYVYCMWVYKCEAKCGDATFSGLWICLQNINRKFFNEIVIVKDDY